VVLDPTKTCSFTYRQKATWLVQRSLSNGGSRTLITRSCTRFITVVLSDSKTRYFHVMKLAYTLLITSRKLSHYCQAHQIEVHTSSTLGEILNNRKATGKIFKWAIELSIYDIVYKPRTTIKAQALSDRDSDTSQGKRAGVLDHQLRWVLTTSSCRSRNTGNIS
jgi:hypothetical protein